MAETLTGRAIVMALDDDKAAERFFSQCAGDAMTEYGEIDPAQFRYAASEIARIAARLSAKRTAEMMVETRRILDAIKPQK